MDESNRHKPDYAARLQEMRERFRPEQLQLLEKLNRSDTKHLVRLPILVIPETWNNDELVYSPLPWSYAWAAPYAKALVVHQLTQVFGAYEHGRLVRWGPISSGGPTNITPSGLFYLTWKSEGRPSTVDPDWFMPWYFNFENDFGLSLHQYTLPGYPASHACVRLLKRDAQWLYAWGEQWELSDNGQEVFAAGTPLLIVGHYNFNAPPPWRSLAQLAQSVELPPNPPLEHNPSELSGPAGP
ncbi:MAG: L,D-transpeptidase [Candidatus Binatia bacterium]